MQGCLECGRPRYCGKGAKAADEFMCRECQRSPATQVRVYLARARERDMTFERAWVFAIERVRWPHDTRHRWEWKGVLGVECPPYMRRGEFERNRVAALAMWGKAYVGMGTSDRAVAVLAA